MAASAVGALLTSILLWCSPDVWKIHARRVLLGALMLHISGLCISTTAASYVTQTNAKSASQVDGLASALLLGRFISGLGHGLAEMLIQVSFAHLTPAAQRPAQMTRFFLANCLGLGVGPIIASFMEMLSVCPLSLLPRFELVGFAQLILAGASVSSVLLFYPNLEDVEDFVDSYSKTDILQSRTDWRKRLIICTCILNSLLRAMVVAGVESGSSLLLEMEFKFPPRTIGIIIAATFLCCWPLQVCIESTRHSISVIQWIRTLCIVSIIGSLLLFPHTSHGLVFAGVLLFPSMALSDGMIKGLMQQYALPTGSYLDQTGAALWHMLLFRSGRFLGPWVVRSLLQNVNQEAYAVVQMFLATLFWLVFEAMIVQPVRALDDMTEASSSHLPDSDLARSEALKRNSSPGTIRSK